MGVCPCPLMPQRPQSPLAPARRTRPQRPLEPGAQDRVKERKISEHVGNINNYTIWILCVGRTWMTGTPRSFRSWRQSLVWDDAACSTREDIHCMSRICLKTNEICALGCYWCFHCVCTCAWAVRSAPTCCFSSFLKLQEKQELQSGSVWSIKFTFSSLVLAIFINQHM